MPAGRQAGIMDKKIIYNSNFNKPIILDSRFLIPALA
jgi:hypothetical protein